MSSATADFSACQPRLAHFTRDGILANAAERGELVEIRSGLVVAGGRQQLVDFVEELQSDADGQPLTRSVINDEEATEIAQPVP